MLWSFWGSVPRAGIAASSAFPPAQPFAAAEGLCFAFDLLH